MTQYATTTDLAQLGLPARALTNISTTIQNEHLTKASSRIDTYLRSRYAPPLGAPYPAEIVQCCVDLASYTLLKFRGFNPDEYDTNFRDQYLSQLEWLTQLSKGIVHLDISADATPTVHEGRPRVVSSGYYATYGDTEEGEQRGW